MTLDENKAASVNETADRTVDPGAGQDARTRVTGSSPLRGSSPDVRVLRTHSLSDLQNPMRTDQHYSMLMRTGHDRTTC